MVFGEKAFIPTRFGFEYVLILTMLAFVAIGTCDVSIASALRRHMMTSAPLTEAMKSLVELVFAACRRTGRIVGDLATRTTGPAVGRQHVSSPRNASPQPARGETMRALREVHR